MRWAAERGEYLSDMAVECGEWLFGTGRDVPAFWMPVLFLPVLPLAQRTLSFDLTPFAFRTGLVPANRPSAAC
jgi:hypothetical protein